MNADEPSSTNPPPAGQPPTRPPEQPPVIHGASAEFPTNSARSAAAAPQRRRRPRTWLWVGLLVAGVTMAAGLVWIDRLMGAFAAAGRSGSSLQEVVLEEHGTREKIAVLEVSGVIMDSGGEADAHNMVTTLRDQLDQADADARVKGVLLKIDSPGGEVLASDDIYRMIGAFQTKTGKPVVASMASVAASGGYYIAAACRWIVANELTITGSIGVIMRAYNYRGLMDKVGVRPEVFKSGKFKDMLSGEKSEGDILPEERRMLQEMVNETFGKFRDVVAAGRAAAARANRGSGKTLAEDWVELADGRILSGKQAFASGFVDELGSYKTAQERILEMTGLPQANFVTYRHPVDFSNLLRLLGKSEPRSLRIQIGNETPQLRVGRLYFLAPGMVPF